MASVTSSNSTHSTTPPGVSNQDHCLVVSDSHRHLSESDLKVDHVQHTHNVVSLDEVWALVGVSETLWLEAKNGSLCLAPAFTATSRKTVGETRTSTTGSSADTITTATTYNSTSESSSAASTLDRHCQSPTVIVFANGAFHLKDLSPSHQTFVNEHRVPARAFVKLNECDRIRFGSNSPVFRLERFTTKRPLSSSSSAGEHNPLHLAQSPSSLVPQHSPSTSSLMSSSSSQSSSSCGSASVHTSSPSKVLKMAMQRMKRKITQFSSSKSKHAHIMDDSMVDGSDDITFIRYDNPHYRQQHHAHHDVVHEECSSRVPLPPVENEYDLVAPDEHDVEDADIDKQHCAMVINEVHELPREDFCVGVLEFDRSLILEQHHDNNENDADEDHIPDTTICESVQCQTRQEQSAQNRLDVCTNCNAAAAARSSSSTPLCCSSSCSSTSTTMFASTISPQLRPPPPPPTTTALQSNESIVHCTTVESTLDAEHRNRQNNLPPTTSSIDESSRQTYTSSSSSPTTTPGGHYENLIGRQNSENIHKQDEDANSNNSNNYTKCNLDNAEVCEVNTTTNTTTTNATISYVQQQVNLENVVHSLPVLSSTTTETATLGVVSVEPQSDLQTVDNDNSRTQSQQLREDVECRTLMNDIHRGEQTSTQSLKCSPSSTVTTTTTETTTTPQQSRESSVIKTVAPTTNINSDNSSSDISSQIVSVCKELSGIQQQSEQREPDSCSRSFFVSFSDDNDDNNAPMMATDSRQDDRRRLRHCVDSEAVPATATAETHQSAPTGGMAFVISFDDGEDSNEETNSRSNAFHRHASPPRRFTRLGRHSLTSSGTKRTETDSSGEGGRVREGEGDIHTNRGQHHRSSLASSHDNRSVGSHGNQSAKVRSPSSSSSTTATAAAAVGTGVSSTLKRSSSARTAQSPAQHLANRTQQQHHHQHLHHHLNNRHPHHQHHPLHDSPPLETKVKSASSTTTTGLSPNGTVVHVTGRRSQQRSASKGGENLSSELCSQPSHSKNTPNQQGQLSESAVYLINRMLEDNNQQNHHHFGGHHRLCPDEPDSSYNSGQFASVQHSLEFVGEYSLPSCESVDDSSTLLQAPSSGGVGHSIDKQTDSAIDDDDLSDTGTYTIEIDDDEHKHRRYDQRLHSASSVTKDDDDDELDDDEHRRHQQLKQLRRAQPPQSAPTSTTTSSQPQPARIDSSTFERKKTSSRKPTGPETDSPPPVSTEESEELVDDDDDEIVEEEDKLEVARRKIDELFSVFENRHRAMENAMSAHSSQPPQELSTTGSNHGSSGTFTRTKRRSSFSSNEAATNSSTTEDEELGGNRQNFQAKSTPTTPARKSSTVASKSRFQQDKTLNMSTPLAKAIPKINNESNRGGVKCGSTRFEHSQLPQSSKMRSGYAQRSSVTLTTAQMLVQKERQSHQPQQASPSPQRRSHHTPSVMATTVQSKSQSAPGTPLMSENRKVFRSRLPNPSVKSISSRKSSIVSSASSMDDRCSSVDEFDDHSSVLSADTYVRGSGAQSDSNRSVATTTTTASSGMRFNRAFALRRARLGMDTCGVELSEQEAQKAKVSQHKSQPKSQPKSKPRAPSSTTSFSRTDGGRFSLRAPSSSSTLSKLPNVAAVPPTRKAPQTTTAVNSKTVKTSSNVPTSNCSVSKIKTRPNVPLSVMSSNENLTNVRHPSPRFGRKKDPMVGGRSMHSDNEINAGFDGESSCDENSGFSRFGRSSLRQNVPYLWRQSSVNSGVPSKHRQSSQPPPSLHESYSVPTIEPIMQKSCTFGNESYNRASYEVLNGEESELHSPPADASMRPMSTFQMGKRFFSTKPHQMAQFNRDFRCSSAAPRIKVAPEPNMMTHSATESLLTRHSGQSHTASSHFETRTELTGHAPVGVVALASGTPPINANSINSRVFSISPLDSLVISAINQLSSKLRTRMENLLERERSNQTVDSETRVLIDEILPRLNGTSTTDRRSSGGKSGGSYNHETNNVSRDLSNILKNLKKAEQIFDVFQMLMDPAVDDSPVSAQPVIEQPESSLESDQESEQRDHRSQHHSSHRASLSNRGVVKLQPVVNTIVTVQNNSQQPASTTNSSSGTNRKSFFIEI